MAVPNIFGSATSAIPLSQLDTNFATPVTIGNTAVQLGNTVTSFGNVTLTNVTISSGNVTVSAGSNTAPSITTVGDTNTGIFFPAADTIAFSEGGAEAARIDSSGRVGIGTTSPAYTLDILNSSSTQIRQTRALVIDAPRTLGGLIGSGYSTGTTIVESAQIAFISDTSWTSTSAPTYMSFSTTASSSTTATERMRIAANGAILAGTTNDSAKVWITNGASPESRLIVGQGVGAANTLDSYLSAGRNVVFETNSNERASIDSSGNFYIKIMAVGGTANMHWSSSAGQLFVTSSSRRFKHDIVEYDKGLVELMQMQPKYFVYNDEPNQKQRAGFIAEDFHDLGMTEYVEYWKDDEGNDTPSEIGYSNMVAILVKSIQEQQALITQLQADVAALKGA